MVAWNRRAGLRSATMECGVLFAILDGATLMLKLPAQNMDTLETVNFFFLTQNLSRMSIRYFNHIQSGDGGRMNRVFIREGGKGR